MLEFQEGFFEQEIRDGFYLDTTMKTVWAAELEVLQRIAEVCDRHGLTWYAAYGTLLGAIRHEGFVPWDDDMDIWLLRKDYNKLMKVLQGELPEGYRVRGPLATEEYDQYHTIVNNGNGISIEKNWLEQFHGCPFTVGIDIFPLDYLPRNKKDRELQKDLFLLAGRVAQIARNMADGEYDAKEGEDEQEAEKRKREIKQEIKEGINYLQKSCKLPVNRQLFKEEKWYALSSEIWKWANHIAMMYTEEESDYLVHYMDYAEREIKKFPKEWFEQVYSATFENFMLPVPAGYENILIRLYGDYRICIKKTGMHDYPYYERQLEQLKEYVKKAEETLGSVNADIAESIEARKESKEIPEQWLPIVLREDGSRKTLILCANDPAQYAANGVKALKAWKQVLEEFKARKDDFTLWWRPSPVMRKVLDQVSPELGGQYQQILNDYKSEGWGICDETEKQGCAVENCDAYYGDMTAIMQPFQNNEKPMMLACINREAYYDIRADMHDIYMRNYIYFSCPDFVMDGEKLYFPNSTFNALVVVDTNTCMVERMIPFKNKSLKEKDLHLKCCRRGNKIYFLPVGVGTIHVYDMESGEQEVYELEGGFGEEIEGFTWDYHLWKDEIYLLPCGGGMGVWKFGSDGRLSREKWWEAPFHGKFFYHGSMDEQSFFSLESQTGYLTITDLGSHETKNYELSDERVYRMAYDGNDLWYIGCDSADIVRWNPKQGEVARYCLPMWDKCNWAGMPFAGIHAESGKIFVVSGNGEELFMLDQEKCDLVKVFEMSGLSDIYTALNKESFFICVDNKLIWIMYRIGEAAVIDLQTLEGKMLKNVLPVTEKEEDYFNRVLLQKAHIFTEDCGWNLAKYLYYCENSRKHEYQVET